jgi:acyl-CoA reductase-like NAD-dependent aldehyde dehydrogenase
MSLTQFVLVYIYCPTYNTCILQSTQTLLSRVPQTTPDEFEQAVDAASVAFKSWSRTSVLNRQRFVLEYMDMI